MFLSPITTVFGTVNIVFSIFSALTSIILRVLFLIFAVHRSLEKINQIGVKMNFKLCFLFFILVAAESSLSTCIISGKSGNYLSV